MIGAEPMRILAISGSRRHGDDHNLRACDCGVGSRGYGDHALLTGWAISPISVPTVMATTHPPPLPICASSCGLPTASHLHAGIRLRHAGSLKNAFDWIVSSGEFVNKPVAALSASPYPTGGERAHASLLSTLTALDADVPTGCADGAARPHENGHRPHDDGPGNRRGARSVLDALSRQYVYAYL